MWESVRPSNLLNALAVLACTCWGHTAFAQANEPSLTTCGGQQYLCAASQQQAACFRIKLNNFGEAIARFEVNWGDGTTETIPFANPLPELTHVYGLKNWDDGCGREEEYSPQLSTITVAKPTQPHKNASFVTFRFPPKADFAIAPGNVVCVGDVVRVTPASCNQTEDRFDFGDGGSSATGLTYVYDVAGTYIITHSVKGVCGQAASSRTITVLDKPVASAEATAGITVQGSPLTVCLDAVSAEVIVSGLRSTGANNYRWSTSPAVPLRQAGNAPVDTLTFTQPGDYTVTLTVNNACNAPSTSVLKFRVVAAPQLRLSAAPDGCAPGEYTPSPLIPGATYAINGVPQTSWPYAVGFGTYTVVAKLSNACGDQELTDEFTVTPPSDIAIASPAVGTTVVCADSDPIPLLATPAGGTWTGAPDIEVLPEGVQFVPKTPGTYDLTYTTGSGACARTDTRTVTVEAFTLSLGTEPDACLPFDYTPTPFYANAAYVVDGRAVAAFPVRLDFGTHTVAASQTNACGTDTRVDTFDITAPQDLKLEIPVASDTAVCASSELIELRASLPGGRWSGAGTFADPTAASTTFDPAQIGLVTLTYTRGEGVCARSASVRVDVQGVIVEPQPISVCVGATSVALTNPVAGGFWSSPECPDCVSGATFTFPAGGAAAAQAYTVRYEVTSATGCVGSATSPIEVFDPRAAFEDLRQVCLGEGLTPTLVTEVADQTVTWTIDGVPADPPFVGLAAGSYVIEATASLGACRDVSRQTVAVVAPPPPVQIIADRTEGCGPLDVALRASSAAAGVDYRWSFGRDDQDTLSGAGVPAPVSFANPSPDTARYTVTLGGSNACGDEAASQQITVYPQPYAEIGTDSALAGCSPYRVVFSNRGSRSIDACRYFGVPGLDIRDCRDTFSLVLTAAGEAQVYPVIIEARNACGVDLDTALVTVRPPGVSPLFNLDDPDYTVCPGQPLLFTDASSPRPTVLTWDLGDGTTATSDTVRHAYAQSDTSFAVRLRVSTGCGYAEQTRVVKVLTRPVGALDVEPYACVGAEVAAEVITAEPSIQVTFGNGQESGAAFAKTRYDSAGRYVVSALLRNAVGCTDSLSREILVNPLPSLAVSGGDTACVGQTLQLSASGADVQTFSWRFPDGLVASGPTAAWTPPVAGSRAGVVTGRSRAGCIDSVAFQLFARNTPVAGFRVSGDSTCVPAELTFADASTGPGISSYDYRFGDGGTDERASGAYTYRVGGVFAVQQIVGIDGVCFDTSTVRVRMLATPRLSAQIVDERCVAEDAAYLDVRVGADDERVGVVGPGLDSVGGGTRFAIQNAGSYLVTATTPFGCDTSATFELAPYVPLDLRLLPDTSIRFGDSLRLWSQVNYADLDYRWVPNERFPDSALAAPWARPLNSTTYELSVARGSCVARKVVRITVVQRDPVYAPNVFSPNGDGINDLWEVFPNASIRELRSLSVFDRWGGLVYFSEGLGDWGGGGLPLKAWDGHSRGRKVNPGVYAWLLKAETFDGEVTVLTGDVTVVD